LRGEPLSHVFKALTPERITSTSHPTTIARIVEKLANGLHAAHTLKDARGVSLDLVHRDFTPQNSYVSCDGTVRVTDFGIARVRARCQQTEGGRIRGKLSYMSPEQLNQQLVDCRSDIWSLGVVAWELLTGRRLFRAASEGETVLSVLSRPIPPPSRFAGGVPRQLDAIVLRALSRDPEARYASANELGRALEALLSASGGALAEPEIAEWLDGLLPGAGDRSDDLVRFARSVVPSARRSPHRLKPVEVPTAAQKGRGARRAARSHLPLSAIGVSPEPSWGRALLLSGAVLAGVGGVTALADRWKPAPLVHPVPVAAAAPKLVVRPLASGASAHATASPPTASGVTRPPLAITPTGPFSSGAQAAIGAAGPRAPMARGHAQ